MNGPRSRNDARVLRKPDGVVRLFWRLLYRNMRLYNRADQARWEHEVLWGRGSLQPTGILHGAGLQREAH